MRSRYRRAATEAGLTGRRMAQILPEHDHASERLLPCSPVAPPAHGDIPVSRPPSTHCKRGHEWSDENTYRPPSRPGERMCLACIRERSANGLCLPCQENRVTIASLRSELASARQQLRAQRRVIADLQRDVSLLRSRQRQPAAITHRRIVDGGKGGRAERRELRRAA